MSSAVAAPELHPPDGARVVRCSGGRVWLADEIVVQVVDASTVGVDDNRGFFDAIVDVVGELRRCPILADIRKLRWVSAEARAYSASDEMLRLVGAMAFIVSTPVNRVIGSFFIKLSNPPYPVRMVTTPHDAVSWLREQKIDGGGSSAP